MRSPLLQSTGQGRPPEQYREKWGLAYDYPMVAPNYAKTRSELAKSMGLGQQRNKSAQPKTAAVAAKVTGSAPKKPGWKKSA